VATASAVLNNKREPLTEQQLTAVYAGDIIYRALVEAGEPLKPGEVARTVGRPDVDLKLARVVLTTNPNMTAVDRKWTLWTRYLDVRTPTDTNIHKILNTCGLPIKREHLAKELSLVYGRPAEIYEETVDRLAENGRRFFGFGDGYFAPVSWLLNLDSEHEDDILFDNFLDDDDVFPYVEAAKSAGLKPRELSGVAAFLDAVGKPVKNKAVQFLIWRAAPDLFSAEATFEALMAAEGVTLISTGEFIGPALTAKLEAGFAVLAEQEVSDSAETDIEEAAQPLVIGSSEKEQLVAEILQSEDTVYAEVLLEDLFDVTPDYRTYAEDLKAVIDTLRTDERVVWVGATRFRAQGTIPGYVFTVPGLLEITEQRYMDADGLPVDQLLEDDGFDGGLEREIMNPLAQDVLDEEPVGTPDLNPPSNARAVIKYHHKQIGTLPLCQFSSGFFPAEPAILETDFILPTGHKTRVWVNNETRLLYGLLDWFSSIPIDSGATFTLERKSADCYLVNFNDESEPSMFISRNRINELMLLQERAETEALALTDITREIMEHYRKGIEFLTLHTEVNIVRRATRRMVASILSEYHYFFQRGGAWVYDAKKLTQGFDKSKRKYLVK
jgi:hypothetical protein